MANALINSVGVVRKLKSWLIKKKIGRAIESLQNVHYPTLPKLLVFVSKAVISAVATFAGISICTKHAEQCYCDINFCVRQRRMHS